MLSNQPLVSNVKSISRLELPGAGQVCVSGKYAYVGHILSKSKLGTSILDVSDPRNPKIVSQIFLNDSESQSHKARVVGDLLFVNSERTPVGRRADEFPKVLAKLRSSLGREPSHAELAEVLIMRDVDIPALIKESSQPYQDGGFKIYDIADKKNPKLIVHQKTGAAGVHRFDVDQNFAYISTEMPGYLGNILVIYDIRNPSQPKEVSRWAMNGQNIAAGETPTWIGRKNRLHHALRFGDELWAGLWHAGVGVIDVKNINAPKLLGSYNYHPPFPQPSHTFMPLTEKINGKRLAVAIDEEDHAHDDSVLEQRRGRPHACLRVFDVSDLTNISQFLLHNENRYKYTPETLEILNFYINQLVTFPAFANARTIKVFLNQLLAYQAIRVEETLNKTGTLDYNSLVTVKADDFKYFTEDDFINIIGSEKVTLFKK
jgi:hypothetical protein